MDAIRFENDILYLLDQTRLPLEAVWLGYRDYRAVCHAIASMVVRGAPAIGISAAYASFLAAREFAAQPSFMTQMAHAKAELSSTRPTALNLFWALERMDQALKRAQSPTQAVSALRAEAIAIHQEDLEMNLRIGAYGAAVIPQGARILTHCNAGALATGGYGTALGVIRAAHKEGTVKMVYCDETRPLLQGARLTAYELASDQIPVTLICDNMAGSLMAAGAIDVVIVGCDRMAGNGDFANKIGTYSLAVLARHHQIPFFTALPGSTLDLSLRDGNEIVIEQRDRREITHFAGVQTAPEAIEVYNPAFDVTPKELLTGIVTDRGVIFPPFETGFQQLFKRR